MADYSKHTAWRYHASTKHSPVSVRTSTHFLDWENEPAPFKDYAGGQTVPLPTDLPQTGVPALVALAGPAGGDMPAAFDLRQLAYLLYYAAGVTKIMSYPEGQVYFRAAACAGALYPIELYVICGALAGLEAGVYHFHPRDFALRRLRSGDWRAYLARAAGEESAVRHAPLTIVSTAITWRSAWKYQARAYRYHFWDDGMILANALAAANALGQPARLVAGFVDHAVDELLAIDGESEVTLTLLAVGQGEQPAPEPPSDSPPPLDLLAQPLSERDVEYRLIREMHTASTLPDAAAVAAWRRQALAGESAARERPAERTSLHPLQPLGAQAARDSLEAVIQRRGSARDFEPQAVTFAELSALLHLSMGGLPAAFLREGEQLCEVFLNVHAVDGLEPGAYRLRRDEAALELIRPGQFRAESAFLALEQPLAGSASVSVFLLVDLPAVLDRYGERGYRVAQLEAGIIGGRLYLAAYALGRGASGLTFYDDDVVRFFSPAAQGLAPMLVVVLGEPRRLGRRNPDVRLRRVGPGESRGQPRA